MCQVEIKKEVVKKGHLSGRQRRIVGKRKETTRDGKKWRGRFSRR